MDEKTKTIIRNVIYFYAGLVTGLFIYYLENAGIVSDYINSLLWGA